ncbi:hypothetical protein GCM10007972_10540 [Iodidimonas muriae]|uniref:Uncharacterized protein n=1 Tax=Iodidimonas muriae TaxID=261467 RepID=A0ABQ2LBC1_9PROT|nr:hypothetical protein JCM17843_23090 [Kordiimonadales bacterium JCM 17843]GGO09220.1 hypothetical protein GCM10007972_10540 [Iodidimonas muriae]
MPVFGNIGLRTDLACRPVSVNFRAIGKILTVALYHLITIVKIDAVIVVAEAGPKAWKYGLQGADAALILQPGTT